MAKKKKKKPPQEEEVVVDSVRFVALRTLTTHDANATGQHTPLQNSKREQVGPKESVGNGRNGAATFAFIEGSRPDLASSHASLHETWESGWLGEQAGGKYPLVAIHLAWCHRSPDLNWISKNLQRKKTG